MTRAALTSSVAGRVSAPLIHLVLLLLAFLAPAAVTAATTHSREEGGVSTATCDLVATSRYPHVSGRLTLEVLVAGDGGPGISVSGDIAGLEPGKHGFHVHQHGNTGSDCAAAGGHFNPSGAVHGGPRDEARHVGDLGNIVTPAGAGGAGGDTPVDIQDLVASLTGGPTASVLGRALVVHAQEDDLGRGTGVDRAGSLATGNAGSRVACCVITASGATAAAAPTAIITLIALATALL